MPKEEEEESVEKVKNRGAMKRCCNGRLERTVKPANCGLEQTRIEK